MNLYQTANFAMVETYWNIGKSIIGEQGGNEKAEYGAGLLKELSKQMTRDLTFPNGHALRDELSWTHYICPARRNCCGNCGRSIRLWNLGKWKTGERES